MKTQSITIDPTWSINEVILRHPEALPLLKAYGFNTCCGAAARLVDAAQAAGIELERLLEAISKQVSGDV